MIYLPQKVVIAIRNRDHQKVDLMVERRMNGDSIQEIAADLGVSRQYIYRVFEPIPRRPDGFTESDLPDLPPATECEVVQQYLRSIPAASYIRRHGLNDFTEKTVKDLAGRYSCSEEQIMNALYKMRDHHPPIVPSPKYPALYRWRMEHSTTISEFAAIAGCSPLTMREILLGWKHLPLENALRIKEHTGLTIEQIYAGFLDSDETRKEAT